MPSPPIPIAPVAGAETDGYATTFEWEPVTDARYFRVELSESDTFEAHTFTAQVENTHALTVYEMLPTDGRPYFWRVQAHRSGGWTDWSVPQQFVPATEPVVTRPAEASATEAPVAAGSMVFAPFLWGWLVSSVLLTAFILWALF